MVDKIFLFFYTIIKEMGKANFSFAILLVGVAQLIEMKKNRKINAQLKQFNNADGGKNLNIDMSGFNDYTDNLEEFVNKQGATLGQDAEALQKMLNAITTCYLYGLADKKMHRKMHIKFEKAFSDALRILN